MKFKTRELARAFAKKTGRKVTDLGKTATGHRWVVRFL